MPCAFVLRLSLQPNSLYCAYNLVYFHLFAALYITFPCLISCNWDLSCPRVFTVYQILWPMHGQLKPVCKKRTSANQQLRREKLCENSVKHAATCPGTVKKPITHHMILRPRTAPLWTVSVLEYFATIHDGLQSVHVRGLQVWVPATVLLPKIQVCCQNSKWPVLETQCLSTGWEIVSMYRSTSEGPCHCKKGGSQCSQTTSLWHSPHDGSSNMAVRQAAANYNLEQHWPGAWMWPEINEIRTQMVRGYICMQLYWCCYVTGPARPNCTSIPQTQLYVDVYPFDENHQ